MTGQIKGWKIKLKSKYKLHKKQFQIGPTNRRKQTKHMCSNVWRIKYVFKRGEYLFLFVILDIKQVILAVYQKLWNPDKLYIVSK